MKIYFLKKLFIKVCRLFDYEIIDQGDLSLPVMNKKGLKNLSNLGSESIVLPMGRIKINRPLLRIDFSVPDQKKLLNYRQPNDAVKAYL